VGRSTRRPLFLFPIADKAAECEWFGSVDECDITAGIADLVSDIRAAAEEGETVLFVMPSLGVAERVSEILSEYQIEARLSLIASLADAGGATVVCDRRSVDRRI
jgi:hypothetical protein